MQWKLWMRQALCRHSSVECHTTLHGQPDPRVETEAHCKLCGKQVPPPPGLYSASAMEILLKRAARMPEGMAEVLN